MPGPEPQSLGGSQDLLSGLWLKGLTPKLSLILGTTPSRSPGATDQSLLMACYPKHRVHVCVLGGDTQQLWGRPAVCCLASLKVSPTVFVKSRSGFRSLWSNRFSLKC